MFYATIMAFVPRELADVFFKRGQCPSFLTKQQFTAYNHGQKVTQYYVITCDPCLAKLQPYLAAIRRLNRQPTRVMRCITFKRFPGKKFTIQKKRSNLFFEVMSFKPKISFVFVGIFVQFVCAHKVCVVSLLDEYIMVRYVASLRGSILLFTAGDCA